MLGIHISGSSTGTGQACGSIAALIASNASRRPQLFRLMDDPTAKINLNSARAVR